MNVPIVSPKGHSVDTVRGGMLSRTQRGASAEANERESPP